MAKFQKGHAPIPGSGRPKGSLDKRYLSLEHWFQIVSDNADELDPEKKIAIAFQALDRLLAKVQNLPGQPTDSLQNAISAFKMMNDLSGVPAPDNSPKGNGNGASH